MRFRLLLLLLLLPLPLVLLLFLLLLLLLLLLMVDAPVAVGLLAGAVLSHGWVGSVLVGGEEDGDLDGALPEGHRSAHQGKQGGEAQGAGANGWKHFKRREGGGCWWRW